MKLGKARLMKAGGVGVVALGIAAGPTIEKNWSRTDAPVAQAVEPSAPPSGAAVPASHARPAPPRTHHVAAVKKESNAIETGAVTMWEPACGDRVRAVLNRGAQPEIAAADFASAEQFMTVAHAARNTQLPFMVLKDRV